MKKWSEEVLENYKIRLALDTNILAYLMDGTFPQLLKAIQFLQKFPFTELVTSRYVIFEFVGIRKKEHFLQNVLKKNTKGTIVNLSTMLKYKDSFTTPELDYSEVQSKVKRKVLQEINKLKKNFDIDIEGHEIHNKLWKPTFDLCLSSRLSREDSLVTISSVFKNDQEKPKDIYILTKDEQYSKGLCDGDEEKAKLDAFFKKKIRKVFKDHELHIPEVIHINNITISGGKKVNLTDGVSSIADFKDTITKKIRTLLIKKNEANYVGETFKDHCSSLKDVLCFEFSGLAEIPKGVYITIIGKNLDFVITTDSRVFEFRNESAASVSVYPITSSTEKKLSMKWPEMLSENENKPDEDTILAELKKPGNLVFISPDM